MVLIVHDSYANELRCAYPTLHSHHASYHENRQCVLGDVTSQDLVVSSFEGGNLSIEHVTYR